MPVQFTPGIAAIAARMLAFIGAVTQKNAPLRRIVPIVAVL
jgi:hypothetical protein